MRSQPRRPTIPWAASKEAWRMTHYWDRLPREAVESPLEIFKTHLDTVPCSLL